MVSSNIILIHLNLEAIHNDVRKYSILDIETQKESTVKDVLRKICYTFDIDTGELMQLIRAKRRY